jgi:hypothetical protein
MQNSEISEDIVLVTSDQNSNSTSHNTSELNLIPRQLTMSNSEEISPHIPSQFLIQSNTQPEIDNQNDKLTDKIKECIVSEYSLYNDYANSSNPLTYLSFSTHSYEYLFSPNRSESTDLYNDLPISPFIAQRSSLCLSSLASGVAVKSLNALYRLSTCYCYNAECETGITIFDNLLFNVIKIPLAIPFLIAGTALQSSICLIPSIVTNVLNFMTCQKQESLDIASSSTLLFLSNGITLNDHLKVLKKYYGDSINADNIFKEVFFKFDKNDFPDPLENNHFDSFKCFLDNPTHYLDDVTTEQSHFFQGKLEKENLERIIVNISNRQQPIIGRIDRFNQILYTFAFNCLVFNFVSDVAEKCPELIDNKESFEAIKNNHKKNILEFKNHIKKYVYQNSNMREYESKLEEFFNICEKYYGKLELLPSEEQSLVISERKILGYEISREKFRQEINDKVLSSNPSSETQLRSLPINNSSNLSSEATASLVFLHS